MKSIDDMSAIPTKTPEKKSESINDKDLDEFLGNQDNYLEFDMGQLDEEELPFMIVDKDSGKVYDTRNDKHVERLTTVATESFRQTDELGRSTLKQSGIR
jgi:hypothetical protein